MKYMVESITYYDHAEWKGMTTDDVVGEYMLTSIGAVVHEDERVVYLVSELAFSRSSPGSNDDEPMKWDVSVIQKSCIESRKKHRTVDLPIIAY